MHNASPFFVSSALFPVLKGGEGAFPFALAKGTRESAKKKNDNRSQGMPLGQGRRKSSSSSEGD